MAFDSMGRWTPNPQPNSQTSPSMAWKPPVQNMQPNMAQMQITPQMMQMLGAQGFQPNQSVPAPNQNTQVYHPTMAQQPQAPNMSQTPGGVQAYLQSLQQAGLNQNNAQVNHPAVAGNPMGFNPFTGGTLNNFAPMGIPNYSNPSLYSAMMTGQSATGGVTNANAIGGVPNQPTFYGEYNPSGPSPFGQGQVANPYYQGPLLSNAISDQNAKTEINNADQDLKDFFDSLKPYSYEYKDKADGEGRRISPMAQDIAKTPLGQAAIDHDERGYMRVNYGKLMGTMLSGLAMTHQEVQELKQSIKQKMKDK